MMRSTFFPEPTSNFGTFAGSCRVSATLRACQWFFCPRSRDYDSRGKVVVIDRRVHMIVCLNGLERSRRGQGPIDGCNRATNLDGTMIGGNLATSRKFRCI